MSNEALNNILNGGKHAGNTVNIQEFMIAPIGAKDFEEAIGIVTKRETKPSFYESEDTANYLHTGLSTNE